VAVADPFAARLATERALRINPRLEVTARARGARDRGTLRTAGPPPARTRYATADFTA